MSFTVPNVAGTSLPLVVGDPNTKSNARSKEYALANNITLAAGARGPIVSNIRKGTAYLFFASFSGTSPSLQLQYRGDDGNFYNIDSARTSNGSDTIAENIGEGSDVCVLNSGANVLNNVYAKLN